MMEGAFTDSYKLSLATESTHRAVLKLIRESQYDNADFKLEKIGYKQEKTGGRPRVKEDLKREILIANAIIEKYGENCIPFCRVNDNNYMDAISDIICYLRQVDHFFTADSSFKLKSFSYPMCDVKAVE
jgi:hypothetical protein